jgi:AMP-polyphosphate phosphotransferase
MFETAEVRHRISKAEYAREVPALWARLLQAQRRLRTADFPVVVIVAGVEMAGKSEVVHRFHEWLDARGVQTIAFWDESDEEHERPYAWRFWRQLPPAGSIAIFMGSWYTGPIARRVGGKLGRKAFAADLARIVELERTLTDGGALLVKLWFHISSHEQAQRLKRLERAQRRKLTPQERSLPKQYERFEKAAEVAVLQTDHGDAPWQVIDAHDREHRDLIAGRILLEALERRLERPLRQRRSAPAALPRPADGRTVLDTVDLSLAVSKPRYEKERARLLNELSLLSWKARDARRSTIAVFEGWDAAGKGGAIRRVVQALDARLYRVIPIGAPTDEERAHHYLWRFWRHVPRAGYVTIYDRSWYGRVLVERVEGFARPEEWGRAYSEINDFEGQLTEHGICLVKFWLHISPDEQLRRFREREKVAHKRHKITQDDWRNREQWRAYELAVEEMVARTSTARAPWTLVAANDKRHARLAVMRTLRDAWQRCLE